MPKPPRILDRPRRPIPGYAEYYEITRRGHVYSLRAKRIIQNPINRGLDPDGREIIQFDIKGQTIQLGVHKTIVEAWLSEDEQKAIQSEIRQAIADVGLDNAFKQIGGKNDLRAATVYYLFMKSKSSE